MLLRDQQLHNDDAIATDMYIKALEEHAPGTVLYYQPMQLSESGSIEQHFIWVYSSTWQQAMLKDYGSRLVLMDATGGTNKLNFPFYALLVLVRSCIHYVVTH